MRLKIFEFQIVIICFETYFCVGLGFNGGWTTVCALAILLQTLIIVIMVALSASSVHEEVSCIVCNIYSSESC